MKPRDYAIGEVVPLGAPLDKESLRMARLRKGQLQRNAKNSRNQAGKVARKLLADREERARLAATPIERAKTHLRQRGFKPVFEERRNVFIVGSHRIISRAMLLAFATEKGWVE
jgi:hypothetical protein